MAVSNIYTPCVFTAGEDLDTAGHEGVAIAIADGKVANNGKEATGVLLTKPKSGEHGSMAVAGVVKVRAGGALAAGGRMAAVTSGYFVAAESGYYCNGIALEAITSGSLGKALVQFPGYTYQVSSL